MRIIAGTWRGQRLEEPRGGEVTRPTADRVREACASMVDSALAGGIEGCRVLDAFAGSGAMGIELLSRGAAHASFFDRDRTAAALVQRNLDHLRCPATRCRVTTGDVVAAAARGRVAGGPFDVVVLDPPYALGTAPAEQLMAELAGHGALSPGCVVLFERSAAKTPPLSLDGFDRLREKRYGGTAVDLLVLSGLDSQGRAAPDPSPTGMEDS